MTSKGKTAAVFRQFEPALMQRFLQALAAWQRSSGVLRWGPMVDGIRVAAWQGRDVVWPEFETEALDIVRVLDGKTLEEDELPSRVAQSLDWELIEFDPPIDLRFSWDLVAARVAGGTDDRARQFMQQLQHAAQPGNGQN